MKRTLISFSAILFLVFAGEVTASEVPAWGSFDWAMNLAGDYVQDWEPGAHLSSISGTVDRDGLLKAGARWRFTFTSGDGCRTWKVDYKGKVKPSDSPYVPGPPIAYDNLRIQSLLAPVLKHLDDNYVEGVYYFYLVLTAEFNYDESYSAEFDLPSDSSHKCALIWCDDEWHSHVFNALVDTKTYEILDITSE
jgi:hypothetical protein